MTEMSRARMIVALCAFGGLAVGCGGRWWHPRLYVSTAVLLPHSDSTAVNDGIQRVLSDDSLARIIERENLYPKERKQVGIAAAVEKMRAQVRIEEAEDLGTGERVIVISCRYHEARLVQNATRALVDAFRSGPLAPEVQIAASDPVEQR
jgi:hypothetical protein